MNPIRLQPGDALIVVDMQNDFVNGSLAVPGGAGIVPALNRHVAAFRGRSLPVVATRDGHSPDHCSFRDCGGPWPSHCVGGTEGAQFVPGLALPSDAIVVSKATQADQEAYSGFAGTDLDSQLRTRGIRRLFGGGLATDYPVGASLAFASFAFSRWAVFSMPTMNRLCLPRATSSIASRAEKSNETALPLTADSVTVISTHIPSSVAPT